MRNILKIASLLDQSGQFRLSDKLFKIAQQNNYNYTLNSDNPEDFFQNLIGYQNTNRLNNFVESMDSYAAQNAKYKNVPIRDIPAFQQYFMNLRNGYDSDLDELLKEFESDPTKKPTSIYERLRNLPGQNTPHKSSAQDQADKYQDKRYYLLNTNTPENFAKSLIEFGKMYGANSLTQAFDAYANAGASYQGSLIKNVRALQELYLRVRNTNRYIPGEELAKELQALTAPNALKNQYVPTNQDKADNFNEFKSLVNTEPPEGLDSLKKLINENAQLENNEKMQLISMIDKRLNGRN